MWESRALQPCASMPGACLASVGELAEELATLLEAVTIPEAAEASTLLPMSPRPLDAKTAVSTELPGKGTAALVSHLCKVVVLVQHILVVQQCEVLQHGLQDHAGQGYAQQ